MVWAWNEETGDIALKQVVETYINQTHELIHIFVNGEEIVTTPTHPFYSPTEGWIEAVDLCVDDILVCSNGKYVVVEKVQYEILETPKTVYNFQVKDFHTYFVSEVGILVHNLCSQSVRFNENQQAVIDLANEYKNGLNRQEAEILVGWANEYGISAHLPMMHPERSGYWSNILHIDIRKTHIPVFD